MQFFGRVNDSVGVRVNVSRTVFALPKTNVCLVKLLHELEGGSRVGKFSNFFSVVRFSNNACVGAGGLNGTCYTKEV